MQSVPSCHMMVNFIVADVHCRWCACRVTDECAAIAQACISLVPGLVRQPRSLAEDLAYVDCFFGRLPQLKGSRATSVTKNSPYIGTQCLTSTVITRHDIKYNDDGMLIVEL